MKYFKIETSNHARRILHSKDPALQGWIDTLQRTFYRLANARAVTEIHDIMDTSRLPYLDPCLIGMDKWVLRGVVQDKIQRRKALMKNMHHHDESGPSSLDARAKLLRKSSREHSRPSRLFAHHTALAAMYGTRGQ